MIGGIFAIAKSIFSPGTAPQSKTLQSTASLRTLLITLLLLLCSNPGAAVTDSAQSEKILVLTSVPALYSITAALLHNSTFEVLNLPDPGRRMSAQKNYLSAKKRKLSATFKRAVAVVTMGKLWAGDPLYSAVRQANIQVINIDGTRPWSQSRDGISLIQRPVSDVSWSDERSERGSGDRSDQSASPYFWLSPANVVRSAGIIAADLKRISPTEGALIDANLKAFRTQILTLKSEFESKFSRFDDVTVFALAEEFVYLSTDLGLFVDGYFLKQDIHWSLADSEQLQQYLQRSAIKVVLHKWQPEASIAEAIALAGAQLLILDSAELGIKDSGQLQTDGLQRQLRANLTALEQAFQRVNE